jgi:nitroreductase
MDFEEAVRSRRMVRNFDDTPVATEVVDRLLDLARRGPTAGHSQGVDFIVLEGSEQTARLWEIPRARDYWEARFPEVVAAPVLVIPIADQAAYLRRYSEPDKAAANRQEASAWPVPYWLTDTAMATMILLLAAVNAGLGAVFFSLPEPVEGALLQRLGVPDGLTPIGVVALGHVKDARPTGSATTRARRPFADVIHRGGW